MPVNVLPQAPKCPETVLPQGQHQPHFHCSDLHPQLITLELLIVKTLFSLGAEELQVKDEG